MRFFVGYSGQRYRGLRTPWFDIVALASLAWLHQSWWFWGRVAGTLIVRAGPLVLTVWRPVQ